MRVFDEIKKDARGLATLRDWWGDDLRHVSQALADHRSLACLRGNDGEACPHNKAPNWWERNIKNPIAKAIKRQLEIKARFAMSTPFDSMLHMCGECGCCLKTKIWTPIDHIKKHTPASVTKDWPVWCWQRIEMTT